MYAAFASTTLFKLCPSRLLRKDTVAVGKVGATCMRMRSNEDNDGFSNNKSSEQNSISTVSRRQFVKNIVTSTTVSTLLLSEALARNNNNINNGGGGGVIPAAIAGSRGLPAGTAEKSLRGVKFPEDWPWDEHDFRRYDETSDAEFYRDPRLTRHIDDAATRALRSFCATQLVSAQRSDIIDVCSSLESYIPEKWPNRRRVCGLGMNSRELECNPALTEFVVHDLNEDPQFPFDDESFDAALCALSIDYLIHPRLVCAEIGRILRPNAVVAIAFSDRVFSSKAIDLWLQAGDEDHIYIVASYLHYAGCFDDIKCIDLSPRRLGHCTGDPLYVVTARRM